MSIHEFHAQLTQTDQPNAVLAALGRLAFSGDLEQLIPPPTEPMDPVWTGGLTAS
jgi:hypothetical protein